MFSSLDRVDILTESGVYVQSDHRSPEEMDERSELSVLFAATRTVVPRRKAVRAKVSYLVRKGASEAVREVLAATGAKLQTVVDGRTKTLRYGAKPRAVAEIVDEAFATLARRVADRESVPMSEAGLWEFEKRYGGLDFETCDEQHGWTKVLELAALVGECFRELPRGGSWVVADDVLSADSPLTAPECGPLPFMFQTGEGGLYNAANHAKLALAEAEISTMHLFLTRNPPLRAKPPKKGYWGRVWDALRPGHE